MHFKYILFFVLITSSFSTVADDASKLNKVEQNLVADIQEAHTSLNTTEQRILREQEKLSRLIAKKQKNVMVLRKKTAAARRLADEEILDIDSLRKRVKKWQDQGDYQHHLLISFSDRLDIPPQEQQLISEDFQEALYFFQQSINRLESQITPQWQDRSVVLTNGKIENAPTLNLGPVSWYLHEDQGGLLSSENENMPTSVYQFSANQYDSMKDVYTTGRGEVVFDPSLDRALELIKKQESTLDHIAKGGIWSIPILFFAFISILIAIYKFAQLLRLPKIIPMLPERLERILDQPSKNRRQEIENIYQGIQGAQKSILKIAINSSSVEKRDDQLVSYLMENKHNLQKLMSVISMTAAVAPLLGLLGTVSGMIETFKMMTIFGAGDPSAVSGGISEALVTTELGLVVAIPALIIHALLSQKINRYNNKLETMAIKISKTEFKPMTA